MRMRCVLLIQLFFGGLVFGLMKQGIAQGLLHFGQHLLGLRQREMSRHVLEGGIVSGLPKLLERGFETGI